MLACSVLVSVLAVRLSGQHPNRMGFVALVAGVLLFTPVRFVLTLGQSDPLEAAMALLALLIVARAPVRSGMLGVLATLMKPPTVSLAVGVGLYSRAPRALVGAGLGALAAVVLVAAGAAMGHSPGSVEGWLRAALATYRTTPPLPLVVFQLGLAAIAVIRLAKVRDLILGHAELTFAVAAGLNVLLGTFLHLNPQSMILIVLPMCFVLRPVLTTPRMVSGWSLVAVGACCGMLSGDALASVSHSVGWTHALLPLGTLGLFLAGATVLRPQLLTPALACMVTNMLITVPPWYGAAQTEFAATGSFGLLVLLGADIARDSRFDLSVEGTAAQAG
jgi:hypothetical protein